MKIEAFFPDQNRHVRFLLGLYIQRKRNELGYSVQDVAAHVEIPPQTYKRMEAGRVKIKSSVFDKMQHVLSLTSSDLNEIRKIACIRYINDLSKNLISNYPL